MKSLKLYTITQRGYIVSEGDMMVKFTAKLISIITVEEALNSEVSGTVRVRASHDDRELDPNQNVAILNIEGTTSYQAYFVDPDTDIEKIKADLEKYGAVLNHNSEEIIKKYVERMNNEGCQGD
ncbi:hypothetical protein MMJJ_12670 [Methanococcus maripaludis]|jgi:hypothetical protein|nr:hypothetical protein MMJJ_12670 [Methanococcus maripaludis]